MVQALYSCSNSTTWATCEAGSGTERHTGGDRPSAGRPYRQQQEGATIPAGHKAEAELATHVVMPAGQHPRQRPQSEQLAQARSQHSGWLPLGFKLCTWQAVPAVVLCLGHQCCRERCQRPPGG